MCVMQLFALHRASDHHAQHMAVLIVVVTYLWINACRTALVTTKGQAHQTT
jgi:hypothetical protein